MENIPTQQRPRDSIQFKPLSEGLGFHPFSDGLPYAPLSKSPNSQLNPMKMTHGSGAVSAGPPRMAKSLPQISVPIAAQSVPKRVPAPAPLLPVRDVHEERELGLGYLCMRSLAYILDLTFCAALTTAATGGLMWNQQITLENFSDSHLVMLFGIVFGLAAWSLVALQELVFGTSLGKRVFHLKLEGSGVRVVFRAFFFWVSVVFLGVGLIWALFDPLRRCLHDRLSGIQPTEM